MHETLEFYELIKLIPISVKLEIIKEGILNLYKKELEISKKSYIEELYYINIIEGYREVIDLVKKFNFQNEEIGKLYMWAKTTRKELGLEDNIYNVYDDIIPFKHKYHEANDNINEQKFFKSK